MSKKLCNFFYSPNEVRTIIIDGEPWFVARDVCKVLDIAWAKDAVARLEKDEKGRGSIPTLGGQQEMLIVNESGLYTLVFSSRKPEARKFRCWITLEVIPTIRKFGAYLTDDLIDAAMEDGEVLSHIAAQLRLERTKTRFLETKLQSDLPNVLKRLDDD